ncbi:MAG: hypothetical protein IT359_13015 [Gemmatimonadaceae bacterium]|nr:hypothetical protein [Gemmatimonadaceae bacterium]
MTMHYITKRIPKLAGLVFVAILAACSADSSTSPVTQKLDASMNVAAPEAPSVVLKSAVAAQEITAPAGSVDPRHSTMAAVNSSNASTYEVTIDPRTSTKVIFGTHIVAFPALTICDPAQSGYGPEMWYKACPKLTTPIKITATLWTDSQGRPQIDFANSIRFYPNSSNQLPAIYLRDPWAAMSSWGRIDYCGAEECVNEAANDPTLETQRDWSTGYLFRLIRHFSGYNVWA